LTGIYLKFAIFGLASLGIIWVSRSSLRHYRSHGFYRFFAWELLLVAFLINVEYWFREPFKLTQIFSWIFLFSSLALIIRGVQLFQKQGEIDSERSDPALVGIEKTTQLVTTGLYAYIRHPFYSSLFFLGWGICLKHVTWISVILTVVITIFLVLTARREEAENISFFGEVYRDYMQHTKMFVPFIF
jgi:protein-S-isoprenylcysteine O-methyltransferase Ste14